MTGELTVGKLAIALTGAVAGWLLAQITTSLRAFIDRYRAKRLLIEELKDIKLETVRLLTFYGRELQIYGAKGVGASSCVGIANPVYENYYKVALISLRQSQRISFQMIHSLVNHTNEHLKEFKEITDSIQKEFSETADTSIVAKRGKRWGDAAKAGYISAGTLQWHLIHHLKNENNPALSANDEIHQSYLQFVDHITDQAEKIIESGKTIDRDLFTRAYNPDNFEPQP